MKKRPGLDHLKNNLGNHCIERYIESVESTSFDYLDQSLSKRLSHLTDFGNV